MHWSKYYELGLYAQISFREEAKQILFENDFKLDDLHNAIKTRLRSIACEDRWNFYVGVLGFPPGANPPSPPSTYETSWFNWKFVRNDI